MTFFGPETPRPFSVISEEYFIENVDYFDNNLIDSTEQNVNFLYDYDINLCKLINNYLNVDCNDDILFIKCVNNDNFDNDNEYDIESSNTSMSSDLNAAVRLRTIKNWPKIFEQQFCLIKPIHMCQISRSEKDDENVYKFYKIITKVEQNIKGGKLKYRIYYETIKPAKYDKIIIKNCLKYFENDFHQLTKFLFGLFKSLRQIDNSLLIIQRIADLNTLPFHSRIMSEWSLNDTKYTNFIKTLQSAYFSVKWDIEIVNCIIKSKVNWYCHLKQNYPYPLNESNNIIDEKYLTSRVEVAGGIRELNEGFFKYQDNEEYLELYDRLLFIGGYHCGNEKVTIAERKMKDRQEKRVPIQKQNQLKEEIEKLSMLITPDIQHLVSHK